MHSATANVTTRKLSSFCPSLCHINMNEDRDSDVVCAHMCACASVHVWPAYDRFRGGFLHHVVSFICSSNPLKCQNKTHYIA